MSDMLGVVAPEAIKNIRDVTAEVVLLVSKIDEANKKLIGSKTPGSSDSATKDLTIQLEAQDKVIQKLQKDLLSLSEAKKTNSKLSAQERVDNAAVNQQLKQQATIVSTVVGAYRQLSAQEAIAARNVQDIISRGKLATQTQKQFNAELRNAQKEWQGYRTRVLAADEAVGRWGRTSKRTIEGANQLAGALGLSLGIAGAVAIGKSIFDITRELQSLDLALKQVTGSAEEAGQVQTFLSKIAEDYGINIQTLTKSYIGFYAGAKNAIESGKISAKDIQQIFESVAKASGALGLSQEQQEGAFLAIQQMISKGNIQAEELRGQLSERLPGAFGILAKSMGVTEVELNKLLKDGKVLAADVLPAFAKELEKAYGIENLQRVETLNASVARLGNSWTDFVRALGSGDNILASGLSAIIDKLAEAVKGAAIILEGAETTRNKTLKSIRDAGYKSQKEDYARIKDLDDAVVARKNIEFQAEIKRLTDEINFKRQANAMILKAANDGNYIDNGAETINANRIAIKAANNEIKSYYGRIAAGNEILNQNNKNVKESTALTKAQLAAIEKLTHALAELYEKMKQMDALRDISNAERDKVLLEYRIKNEALYMAQRLKLSQQIADKEFQIESLKFLEEKRLATEGLEEDRRKTLLLAGDNAQKKAEINAYYDKISKDKEIISANEFRTKTDKITEDDEQRKLKIKEEAYKEFQDYIQTYGRKTGDEEKFGQNVNFLQTGELDKMANEFKDFYKEQIKAKKEYYEDLKKQTQEYLRSFRESLFSESGFGGLNQFFDRELNTLTGKFETTFSKLWDGAKTTKEKFAVAFEAISQIAQDVFNKINEVQQNKFELQYARLEKEKDIAIQYAGESDAAKKEIERQYEQRRREIQRREQKAAQQTAVINAIINTAQAVVGALAQFGSIGYGAIALAALAAGVGAAQIAIIKSQKYPEYFKGVDNAPDGLAWTQERGAEIITDKKGNVKTMGSDKGAQLTKMTAGDKVYTAEQSRKIMFDRNLNNILSSNSIDNAPTVIVNNQSALTDSHVRQITNAIQSAPVPHSWIDSDGHFRKAIQRSGKITEVMNNRAFHLPNK